MMSLIYGVYEYIFSKPVYNILLVGLDNTGKTTLLEQIKAMHNQRSINLEKITPTIGLNIAKIEKQSAEFCFRDLGGQGVLRKIWKKYFADCHGLIFLIDGSDEIRFKEVKETIDDIFQEGSELQNIPVLFLLNKNDKSEFRGVDFIAEKCQLNSVPCTECVILPISAVDQTGLEASLNWIFSSVLENQKS